jgi:hypothetical protein
VRRFSYRGACRTSPSCGADPRAIIVWSPRLYSRRSG